MNPPNRHFSLHLTLSICVHSYQPPPQLQPHLRGKKVSNAFNAILISSTILSEEDVPIFEYHLRFSPLEIYFGVEELKRIFLSSLSVPYPSSKKRLKTQGK